MCWLACLPRIVSTLAASPWSWFSLPKNTLTLSKSFAPSRNCLLLVSRDSRAITSFMPPYSPAM